MMHYRGGAGASGGGSGRGSAGGGRGGGSSGRHEIDPLRHQTDLAQRKLKRLRKPELEQVCACESPPDLTTIPIGTPA